MAHFAEIDSNNKVLRVLVIDNSQENRGQEFLANDLGLGGTWIQTSYNANFRNKFAAVGDVYNEELDIFDLSLEQKATAAAQAAAEEAKAAEKEALLERLGITAEEAKLLLS
jgi:hypothetical protein